MEAGPVLVVNVDIAFLTNFVTDFAWLLATGSLAGVRPKWWRVAVAAALGAAAAVWAYFPDGRWLAAGPGALLGTTVLLAVAFWPCSLAQALRTAAYCILSGAAMAGVALLIGGRGLHPVSDALVAAGLLLCLAGGRYLWQSARDRFRLTRGLYRLQIRHGGSCVELPALMDTGNALRDPLTGTPVAVVAGAALEGLLPGAVLMAARDGWEGFERLPGDWAARCRLVPYRAVGRSAGMLLAFVPDGLAYRPPEGKDWVSVHGLVGLAGECLHPEGLYQALLPPKLVEAAAVGLPNAAWEGETG